MMFSLGNVEAITLDSIKSQVIGGYSFTPLFSDSTLSVNLRRAVDNATQNFGFVSGQLDIAGITTFANGSNLFVTRFYDQTGNGHDVTQSNQSLQPRFFTSGGSNNEPYLAIANGSWLGIILSQPLPFTVYSFIKMNVFNFFFMTVGLGNADVANAIVQRTSGEGNFLGLAMGVAWKPFVRFMFNLKWSLFRHGSTAGNGVFSVDDNPVIGNVSNYALMGIGNNSPIQFVIGDPNQQPDFRVSTMLYCNTEIAESDHVKIVKYISQDYAPIYGTPYIAFGDSITFGADATDVDTLSYVELTTVNMGLNLVNYGVSSTDVYDPATPLPADLITAYANAGYGTNKDTYVSYCYGANSGFVSDPIWVQTLENAIIFALSQGFNPKHIAMVAQLYQSNKIAQLQSVNAIFQSLATQYGLVYVDNYTWGLNNGGDSLLVDGTHPNDTGHAGMAMNLVAAWQAANP